MISDEIEHCAAWRAHVKKCAECRRSIQGSIAGKIEGAWHAVKAQLPIGGEWSPATPAARAALRDLRGELARLANLLDGADGRVRRRPLRKAR